MSYRRQNFTASEDNTLDYLTKELDAIERSFNMQNFVQLKTTAVAPTKPRNGMVVYADGTSWNPGSGEGFYGYYAGSWKKLG